MNKFTKFIITVCVIGLLQANAMAKLLITPTRVELNGSKRTQSLKLINESSKQVTYRIEYVYQNMTESGTYAKATPEQIKERKQIERFVLYSPRQVTLEPKQTQTVRFALRKVGDISSEYNAHILFKEIQKKSSIPQLAKDAKDGDFSIEITPLFNIAIPVFVSNKNNNIRYEATITDTKVDMEKNTIDFNLNNQGKHSPYGRVVVKFYKGRKLVAQSELNGLAVALPLKTRHITLNFSDIKFDRSKISSVKIEYNSTPESGKLYVIARDNIVL